MSVMLVLFYNMKTSVQAFSDFPVKPLFMINFQGKNIKF